MSKKPYELLTRSATPCSSRQRQVVAARACEWPATKSRCGPGSLQPAAEAEKAFKNAGVYLEKYIERPRHVEVQIIADNHGNVVHLWERDCSMQRRHQKLIEESPAQNFPPKSDTESADCAVNLVKTANYTNAGTCEFIVDKDFNFYFIEVNARIQVEHPVTELVTGIDLIKQQIRIAAGNHSRSLRPISRIPAARLNSESTRKIRKTVFVAAPERSQNCGCLVGQECGLIPTSTKATPSGPYYDSMIGKLIVYKPTRQEAIECMRRCLHEFVIEGIKTTLPLARRMFTHADFVDFNVDTTFVERTF
jgi:acetyl-CoA carboxylase biotin carboxylase subunit